MRLVYRLFVVGLFFLLVSCSSKIQHTQDYSEYAYSGEKYSKIELSVNKEASEDNNDIMRFDDKKLLDMIERRLETAGLISNEAVSKIKIEITDIRIRSSLNAVMWGFMAGDDHIKGKVTLIGIDDKFLHQFDVSASYALGGLVGGLNETRTGWLFEKFSKLVLEEIVGKKG